VQIATRPPPGRLSELWVGLWTPYHGIFKLIQGIGLYQYAVCGLPTTFAGPLTRSAFGLRTNSAIAREGGQETTNGACCCGLHRFCVMTPWCGVGDPRTAKGWVWR
jgi:hypothetical protein